MVNCNQYNNQGVRRLDKRDVLWESLEDKNPSATVRQDINYITLSYTPPITDITATQDISYICFSKWSVGDLEKLVKFWCQYK